ncbi:MAG: Zn-dependent hydrolase [Firmicutes bacterium]|nr:Zn-dependent hydrolase [Bacillota bacterium]
MLKINSDRFLQSLRDLSTIGATPEGGVTRYALTDIDWQAREWLKQQAASYGFTSHLDAAGNLFIYDPEIDVASPPVLVGSHVDTVPNGGRYDGALGVLAGLESLISLKEAGAPLARPVKLAVWTEEEGSRFRGGLVGSRAFIGEVPEVELNDTDAQGVTLAEALRQWGLQPEELPQVASKPGQVHAYVELHIEQGAKLDFANEQIGVVTGIVGIRRYDVVVMGQANHAGTTPMDMRRDALVAAAQMILAVEQTVKKSQYTEAVGTVGRINVEPGGVNVIPGKVEFSLEIRDLDIAAMDALSEQILQQLQEIALVRGVEVSFEHTAEVKPAPLAPAVQQIISSVAEDLGYSWRQMPSGAGHDAQHLARICPTGMIFVPSVKGISHSPQEFTPDEDCVRGANVLLNTILRLAGSL